MQVIDSTLANLVQDDHAHGQYSASGGRIGPLYVEIDSSRSRGASATYTDGHIQSTAGFCTVCANACVFKGKWQYEVTLESEGVMQIGWMTTDALLTQTVRDTPGDGGVVILDIARFKSSVGRCRR